MDPAPPTVTRSPGARPSDTSFRRRVIVRAIFLLLTLFTLYVLWPSLLKVFAAWPDLLTINPAWFVVMFLSETASFMCAWGLQRLALRTRKWFAIATSQLWGTRSAGSCPAVRRRAARSSTACSSVRGRDRRRSGPVSR